MYNLLYRIGMTAFKNIICCLAATLTFISVSAQSVQDRFVSAAKNHCVEFSYSFVMHASAPFGTGRQRCRVSVSLSMATG